MKHVLFSEINPLYASCKETPNTFRFIIHMTDPVEGDLLRAAVEISMRRYPYFCIRLGKQGDKVVFEDNPLPVIVSPFNEKAELNSERTNYHLIAFSWKDHCIFMDMCHALTDGTGAYALLRTLLYYYCTARYHCSLSREGIRLPGDEIPQEEWEDPAPFAPEISSAGGAPLAQGLNLKDEKGSGGKQDRRVWSLSLAEQEFMRFSSDHDGSPGTMAALFLSRAISSVHPDAVRPVRVSLCVNQRPALQTPLAHQSLVGGAWLEYKEQMRSWPLERQATAYRGMVFVQTMEENVLAGLTSIKSFARHLLTLKTDEERMEAAGKNSEGVKQLLTASVSYVGKARFGEAERYIRDFHVMAPAMNENLLIEISAVNGRFILDIIQNFSDPVYVNAFREQLEENGILYEFQGSRPLELPPIRLPWIR